MYPTGGGSLLKGNNNSNTGLITPYVILEVTPLLKFLI
jgi:hypothetical protein